MGQRDGKRMLSESKRAVVHYGSEPMLACFSDNHMTGWQKPKAHNVRLTWHGTRFATHIVSEAKWYSDPHQLDISCDFIWHIFWYFGACSNISCEICSDMSVHMYFYMFFRLSAFSAPSVWHSLKHFVRHSLVPSFLASYLTQQFLWHLKMTFYLTCFALSSILSDMLSACYLTLYLAFDLAFYLALNWPF